MAPPALALCFSTASLQLAVGQVLDLGVERQANILAILRRLGRADILDDVAAPVTNDRPAARAPEQAALECQLDPLQALVVHAGETDDMGGHVAGRVEAAVFLFLMHAGEFLRGDAIGGFRRHLALDEGEGLFGGDLGIQLAHAHVQQAGQLALLLATHRRASPGIAQMVFIGVDTASMSPLRSTILPREAEISMSRR